MPASYKITISGDKAGAYSAMETRIIPPLTSIIGATIKLTTKKP